MKILRQFATENNQLQLYMLTMPRGSKNFIQTEKRNLKEKKLDDDANKFAQFLQVQKSDIQLCWENYDTATMHIFFSSCMSDFWDLQNYDTATMHFKFSSAGHVERREHVVHAQCASASARRS
jgi:hypothetical protein